MSEPKKVCLNCGTENELQRGQCVSCHHNEFITPEKRATGRKEGFKEILISLFLVGVSFYALYLFRDKIFVDKTILALVLLTFFVAIGSLLNSIYKFRRAKNILIWHIAVIALYLAITLWGFWS